MKLIKKQGSNICFAFIAAALACTPLMLNAGILSSSSFVLFLGKCIAFAIVAIGLDMGLHRHTQSRSWTLFRTRRILHGNVSEIAGNRRQDH